MNRFTRARRAAHILGLSVGLTALWATSPIAGPRELVSEVQELLGSDRGQGLKFALQFVPLEEETRRPTVSVGAQKPLIPASVTKLVTSAAALDVLGANYTFETRVHRTGDFRAGVLSGDLWVSGDGDPFLVSERLWLLCHRLRSAGLRQVDGRLIIHASGFPLDDPTAGESLGGSDRSYAARPSGVAMNFNSHVLRLTSAPKTGERAIVSGDPYDLGYFEVDNRLRTAAPGTSQDFHVDLDPTVEGMRYEEWCHQIQTNDPTAPPVVGSFRLSGEPLEVIRLTGRLPMGTADYNVYRRARYPLPFVGSLFLSFLREFEIEVNGPIEIAAGTAPDDVWMEFPSLPVAELLTSMNRYSSNFIANQLALAVHRERFDARLANGNPGSMGDQSSSHLGPGSAYPGGSPLEPAATESASLFMEDAGRALTDWLRENTTECRGCALSDGSGLSTENLLTAAGVTELLVRAWDDLAWQPKLLFGLPGPGQPGTLRNRFRGDSPPVLWAKTGTLSDTRVSSLAGYVEDANGEAVAFTLILNAEAGSRWTVPAMQDLQEYWIRTYLD